MAGLAAGHSHLVDGAAGHTRDKILQKLTQKIWISFYVSKIQMRASLESEYTAPPAPKSLNCNTFLLNTFSCQDVRQQLALLTITYVRSLQHWAEQVIPSRSPESCPLAESIGGTEGDGKRICCLQPSGCYTRFRNDLLRTHPSSANYYHV